MLPIAVSTTRGKPRTLEQKMQDMIQTAKSLNISKDELNAMMDILYEEV